MAYQPTPNTTTSGSLTHQITTYYRRKGLDRLLPMFVFFGLCEPDQIPKRNGKTMQWFRYSSFGTNTSAHSEGTVGTSLQPTSATITATLKEYADFISYSGFLKDTEIDPTAVNYSELLSERAANSVDTITRTEFDATTSTETDTIGATFTASDIRADVARLKGVNVRPKPDGSFRTVIHPYLEYDLQSDNSAGGWMEVAKYTEPERMLSGEIGRIGGSRILSTTNVKTSGTAPNVLYYAYTVGQGAVGAVDLAGSGPAKVRDPQNQMFNINVIPGGPGPSDPEGMIGGYVSYLYRYVVKDLDSTTPRHRKVKANAALV